MLIPQLLQPLKGRALLLSCCGGPFDSFWVSCRGLGAVRDVCAQGEGGEQTAEGCPFKDDSIVSECFFAVMVYCLFTAVLTAGQVQKGPGQHEFKGKEIRAQLRLFCSHQVLLSNHASDQWEPVFDHSCPLLVLLKIYHLDGC